MILLTAVLIFLPLGLFRRKKLNVRRWDSVVGYFTAVGLAFMFVEIGMMQRFTLFLGHPGYSIPVVLASLLVAAGIGSYLSTRIRWSQRGKLGLCLVGIPVVLFVYLLILAPLMDAFLGAPFSVRVFVTVVLMAIPGVFMGMPFPVGLSVVSRLSQPVIAWAWGINGAASVLGSILVIFVAMGLGFTWALGVAGGLYLAALGLLWPLLRGAPAEETVPEVSPPEPIPAPAPGEGAV